MSRAPAQIVVPPTPGSGRPYTLVGVLMTIALAIVVAGVLWMRQPGGRLFYLELRETEGLRVGAPVRFRGLDVGMVDDVAFTDTSVRVTMRITRDDVPIRLGTGGRIGPMGIFGDHEVELVPGDTPSAPLLPPGSTLARAAPDSARIVAQEQAAAALRAQARELLERRGRRDGATATAPSGAATRP